MADSTLMQAISDLLDARLTPFMAKIDSDVGALRDILVLHGNQLESVSAVVETLKSPTRSPSGAYSPSLVAAYHAARAGGASGSLSSAAFGVNSSSAGSVTFHSPLSSPPPSGASSPTTAAAASAASVSSSLLAGSNAGQPQ